MSLQPIFKNRALAPLLVLPNLTYSVDRISKTAIGGPLSADISVQGNIDNLFELVEYLRYGVEIDDDALRAAWWGMVYEVEIRTGKIRFSVSLDTMMNQVVVYYGPGHNTAIMRDTESIGEYSKKTGVIVIAVDDANQAVKLQSAILARRKYPIPNITMDDSPPGATIYCKGWTAFWEWGIYVNRTHASLDTAGQIALMASGDPSGLAGFDNELAGGVSGVATDQYRDGAPRPIMTEITELLNSGTTNSKRMLINVDVQRRIHLFEEPASGTDDYWIDSQGNVTNYLGTPIPKYLVEAGKWIRLKDIVPATADISKLADPSKIFLERVEYDAQGDTLHLVARDIPYDLDIFKYGE